MDVLQQGIRQGNKEKVEEILKEGAAKLDQFATSGMTPLHILATTQHDHLLPLFLKVCDINQRAEKGSVYDGYTPLHFSAERPSSIEILRALIEAGADVKAKDILGRCPLHVAALKGNLQGVEALLPVSEAVMNVRDVHGRTPLMLAGSQGHYLVVKCLLSSSTVAIDLVDNDGNTALHHCFQIQSQQLFNYNYPLLDGHYQSAFEIAKGGGNLGIRNRDGDAALDVINISLAELLEVLSKERSKFQDLESIEELISLEPAELEARKVDPAITEKLMSSIVVYSKVMERELALRKTRGSCPFVDNSVVPEIRKFKNSSSSLPSFVTASSSGETSKPTQDKGATKAGECPMGFGSSSSPSPSPSSSTTATARGTNAAVASGQDPKQTMTLTPQQLEAIIASRRQGGSDPLLILAASAIGGAVVVLAALAFQRFAAAK